MTSVRHDAVTRFTSRGQQRRFEGSIRCCGLWERKPRTRKALGNGYQVRPDLVTKAEYIKVSRGTGIPKRTVTYITQTIILPIPVSKWFISTTKPSLSTSRFLVCNILILGLLLSILKWNVHSVYSYTFPLPVLRMRLSRNGIYLKT